MILHNIPQNFLFPFICLMHTPFACTLLVQCYSFDVFTSISGPIDTFYIVSCVVYTPAQIPLFILTKSPLIQTRCNRVCVCVCMLTTISPGNDTHTHTPIEKDETNWKIFFLRMGLVSLCTYVCICLRVCLCAPPPSPFPGAICVLCHWVNLCSHSHMDLCNFAI